MLINKRRERQDGGRRTRLRAAHGSPRSLSTGCVAKIGEFRISKVFQSLDNIYSFRSQ